MGKKHFNTEQDAIALAGSACWPVRFQPFGILKPIEAGDIWNRIERISGKVEEFEQVDSS